MTPDELTTLHLFATETLSRVGAAVALVLGPWLLYALRLQLTQLLHLRRSER